MLHAYFQKLQNNSDRTFKLVVQFACAALGWLLLSVSTFLLKDYGVGVFVAVPIIITALPVYIIRSYSKGDFIHSFYIAFGTLLICSAGILLLAIEGLICMVMALPLELIVAIIGAGIGHKLAERRTTEPSTKKMSLILFLPLTLFADIFINTAPTTYAVTTTVEVNAPPKAVWKNVVEFSKLPPPDEFLFKTGIAYPVNAVIDGRGVGAIRRCNFTTGSFVEPITVWKEPNLLAFSVLEQPEPMVELSPYDIEPAHLHGYFVSEKGQFKLTDLGNGKTLLEGTTWYHHKISPEFYWQYWSDAIIHSIHHRVLNCVKAESEKGYIHP